MNVEHAADEIDTTIRVLHRLLRRPFDADIAGSGLTVPQVSALEELAKEDGLSLKELSRRMVLSHSTVSGIIDRLERRELVKRVANEQDRRYSRIVLAENVNHYIREAVPQRRLGPLLEVLAQASADERQGILTGLRTLRRLLEATPSENEAP
jgi:DNA-binding MarR family transcriptional regulator